jgi:hypothetical protein
LGDKKISFSKEVAETLGLESAVILDLYNHNVLDNNSYDDLFSSIEENAKYLSVEKIKSAIDKLVKYKFISVQENNGKQNFVVRSASKNKDSNSLSDQWMPSRETYEVIAMTKISEEFISLKLKEFKIYWIERGQQKNNWNSTFIDFMRREWAKELNSNKSIPHVIDENWYPDDDVFDILNLSEITKDSAIKYLSEFILYWKDKGAAFTTWNSKFIDHVKRRHMMNNNLGDNEENKKYSEPGKYKQDFKTRKNDNTWAKEINLD